MSLQHYQLSEHIKALESWKKELDERLVRLEEETLHTATQLVKLNSHLLKRKKELEDLKCLE